MTNSQDQNLTASTLEIRVCEEIGISERFFSFGVTILKNVEKFIRAIPSVISRVQVMKMMFANLNNHSSPPSKNGRTA